MVDMILYEQNKKMNEEIKEVYLMHLSDKNSNEQDFKRKIQEITGAMVVVCPK